MTPRRVLLREPGLPRLRRRRSRAPSTPPGTRCHTHRYDHLPALAARVRYQLRARAPRRLGRSTRPAASHADRTELRHRGRARGSARRRRRRQGRPAHDATSGRPSTTRGCHGCCGSTTSCAAPAYDLGVARGGRAGGDATPPRRRRGPRATRGCAAAHVPLAHDPAPSRHRPRRPRRGRLRRRALPRPRGAAGRRSRAAGVPVRAYGRDWSGHPVDRLRTWAPAPAAVPRGRDLPRAEAYGVMAGAPRHAQRARRPGRLHDAHLRGLRRRGASSSSTAPTSSRLYEPGRRAAVFALADEAARLCRARAATDRAGPTGCARPAAPAPWPSTPSTTASRVLEALWTPDPPRATSRPGAAGTSRATAVPAACSAWPGAARHRPARRPRRSTC